MHYYRKRRNGSPTALLRRQYSFDPTIFDRLTKETAWLLGLIWSDGWMQKNTTGITSKDRDLLEAAEMVLKGTDCIVAVRTPHGAWRIAVTSPLMARRLRALGLHESKSLTIDWPAGLAR